VTRLALQRTCACGGTPGPDGECAGCKSKRLALQRLAKRESAPPTAPSLVTDTLRSRGRPLDDGARGFMEGRFRHDFSRVRVHTDARAAESARAVDAHAYTVGPNVVFGAGQYAPETASGRRLLAHELTHVLQQNGPSAAADLPAVRPANDAWEREGEEVSRRVVDGPAPSSPVRVRRLPQESVQRYSFGSGAGPDFGGGDKFVEVPKEHKDRVDAALGIVSRVVNNPRDFPACPKFFEKNCSPGSATSLVDSFNRAVIWFNEGAASNELGGTAGLGGADVGYTALAFRIGRWAMAATFIHELIHVCGQGDHEIGDQAKDECGRLPDIIALSPKIEIKNPL
jgi:hypothetical protein